MAALACGVHSPSSGILGGALGIVVVVSTQLVSSLTRLCARRSLSTLHLVARHFPEWLWQLVRWVLRRARLPCRLCACCVRVCDVSGIFMGLLSGCRDCRLDCTHGGREAYTVGVHGRFSRYLCCSCAFRALFGLFHVAFHPTATCIISTGSCSKVVGMDIFLNVSFPSSVWVRSDYVIGLVSQGMYVSPRRPEQASCVL